MAEFRMPSLGADMEAGTLVEWNVQSGDRVKRGDIIALVETDKGLIEVEVFEDGVVDKIHVQPGAKVPVGTALAFIRAEGAAPLPAAAVTEPTPAVVEPKRAPAAVPSPPLPVTPPGERVIASPSARKLAAELGVDLTAIHGSGPRGAIQRADIELASRAAKPAPPAEKPAPPPLPERPAPPDYQAGMRRAIAAAMSRSNREIPHYYLEMEIDMECALAWLEGENLKRSIKDRLLPAVLLLKAVARALADVPELNGYWLDDRHQVSEAIHIGFAISMRQGGLITPAIHNVDMLSHDELMGAMRDLITRTRAGRLRSSEMTDATITVTNLGDLGVKTVFGVIYPPQVALVGFGRIMERPWAENGMLGVRRVMSASLAGDHRATDGHRGSQFLEALNKHLQGPETL
ncbi:dihydrolipoamide acetyltransferase family protein [Geotalea uraniireducens]|uniref:Dihydrolipoamide acetyltransferase component of pyruvate dehydrogenase complex n=1 Tax=Geotalea uraniireducens (strain Rf4) TaxID=351605 RepID=A5GEF2_GEOUR|nr:dihydrolipoamide acetyltransferase family protein [Geotalea uraniireducens]ABQ25807.1 catalytic domain of components of various dehydrogenase complexes [Geotalea uraniireducens Rf4]